MPRERSRKRKANFKGNQHTQKKKTNTNKPSCASAKKITIPQDIPVDSDDYNIIINFSVLKTMLADVFECPDCGNARIDLNNNLAARQGFCCELDIKCSSCSYKYSFYTSKKCPKKEIVRSGKLPCGKSPFQVNVQSVLAFREIGKGYASIKKFSTLMNMPPAISKLTYNRINELLHLNYTQVANFSSKTAAKETYNLCKVRDEDEISNCQVSVDGTWQKRGHASINGVVTVISRENGKCLDTHVMSKSCMGCKMWSHRKNDPHYNDWKLNHNCQANHVGSSGSMEANGAKIIFHRSIENHGLRYTHYIGDGDTSSFSVVSDSKPYGDIPIQKLECIGHVQKRLGTRLRNLCQKMKGNRLSDGKLLNGRGRLTEKAINTLQNYYGMAIRQNVNNVYKMKKCIWAVLFHNADIAGESVRHQFCPREIDSWCLWQSDKLTGKSTYKKKLSLDLAIKTAILPIFKDLSNDELLSKCTHGQTQNDNESLNGVIWKKCPKSVYVSRKVLEIAVSSAVVEFNDGVSGLLPLYRSLGLTISHFLLSGLRCHDRSRIAVMATKSSKKGMAQRKHLRAVRKGYIDSEKESEKEPSYSTGAY